MSDDILKQEIIAGHLKAIYKELRQLKRKQVLRDREDSLSQGERPNNNDFTGELRFTFDACIISSVISTETVLGFRTIASTTNSPGWVIDPEFSSKPIVITVPPRASIPAVDDIVPAFFSGIYTNLSGTALPRYGTFGVGVARRWFVVVTVNRDVLQCREWSEITSAAVIPAPDPGVFIVAKPRVLRGLSWDGQTLAGVDYTNTDGSGETGGFTTRLGEGSVAENQLIIPPYIPSLTVGTVILVESLKTQVTFMGTPVTWQDMNNGARAWSEEA